MELKTRVDLHKLLPLNQGIIFIKLGATWCKPCELINDVVKNTFEKMPENVKCFVVDVDESFDLYAFLKSKRMVQGIPTILCYHQGNESYIPDDSISGTDIDKIYDFFRQNLENI
tara:strand:- start:1097 stop:1441 length:345 start_codon:yes stop_codon:yes gene_type:complete